MIRVDVPAGQEPAAYADPYVTDPRRLDDDGFWAEVNVHFSDDELMQMMLSIGAWFTGGRLQAVLGV